MTNTIANIGLNAYTPEMGQKKPIAQMEATRAYYGKHVYIDTPLELKGRGITFQKKYTADSFTNPNDRRVGWNSYLVTNRAFDILRQKYSISMECLLD